MKELIRRLLTGAVYVAILLAAVLLNSDAFDFLFMTLGLICLHEYRRMTKLKGYTIFIAYLALWWIYIYLINGSVNKQIATFILLGATLTVDTFLLRYLFSKKTIQFKNLQKLIIGLFYIGGGCIFLTLLPYHKNDFEQLLIIGVFLLIWINDSFAYLVGKTIGKHKLFPSVSPKKTIEGTLGGLIFALVGGYILSEFDTNLSVYQWLILAMVIVVSGSLGDLIESKFKRAANVKDSGAILPGHGGMLDRLDSLVFAAPFAYLTLILFSYVS